MKRRRFHYYSKNRKLWIKFTLILTSSILMNLFSIFGQISIYENKKEQAENLYGSWNAAVYDVSETTYNKIRDHQMIDTIGEMDIYGDIISNDEILGSIGDVDSSFLKLSNIVLKKGRMPRNENEIVIEALKLDQMGIDYNLDQTIALQIVQDDMIFEKDYTLVGILDNYSTTWLSNGSLVSYFVQSSDMKIVSKNIFMTSVPGYSSIFNEMNFDEDSIQINSAVEFEYDPLSRVNFPYTLLATFAVLYSILLMSYLFSNWTNQHSKEIQMLKSLGASNGLLCKDIVLLLTKTLFIPVIFFVVCSFFLHILWQVILVSIFIFLLSLIFVLVVCFFKIKSIPENMNTFSQEQNVSHKTIKTKYKKQTSFRIFIRSMRFHWKREIIQVLIPVILLTLLYQAMSSQILNQSTLNNLGRLPDVSLTGSLNNLWQGTSRGFAEISDLIVDEVSTNKSFENVETYYEDQSKYITWDAINDSHIFKREQGYFGDLVVSKDWNDVFQVFPQIISSDSEFYYDFLKKHLDEGTFDRKAFINGEVIYIYLPEYTVVFDHAIGEQSISGIPGAMNSNPEQFTDTSKVYKEDTIKVGDTITIHSQNEPDKKVIVGGIITHYMEETGLFNGQIPYRIFASNQLNDDKINTINIQFKENIKAEPLESYLSTLSSKNNLIFTNNVQEKRNQEEILKSDHAFYLSVIIIVFIILAMSQIHFIRQKHRDNQKKWKLFNQLGISNRILNKINYYEMVIKLFIIFVLALLLFLGIQYYGYIQNVGLLDTFIKRFNSNYWSWFYYLVINFGFFIIYLLSTMLIVKNKGY